MKAVIYEKYGSPSVLSLTELPVPVITNSELLVKIEATTVTSGDIRMRSSDFPPLYYLPGRLVLGLVKPKKQILGHEFAGTVLACGDDVKRFKAGDKVYGTTGLKPEVMLSSSQCRKKRRLVFWRKCLKTFHLAKQPLYLLVEWLLWISY